ncbi:hypothetical protein E1B28_003225 [Marasmius oreades]|uniref:Uncharacterized protein n=1 Tax=Marasmius oreades TaxID=181124 RepID=A0A9P7RLI2_9AGAR|nr:uncharacterized protein E1B28_003225 [Marasmius oreades]KAG7085680.1 hypothetical protein E1B28_003225 [Marasmius oreades]
MPFPERLKISVMSGSSERNILYEHKIPNSNTLPLSLAVALSRGTQRQSYISRSRDYMYKSFVGTLDIHMRNYYHFYDTRSGYGTLKTELAVPNHNERQIEGLRVIFTRILSEAMGRCRCIDL